jgi:phage tail tape-measure protein
MGNQNARGPHDKGGIRAGLVGSLLPFGAGISGAYLGATGKSNRALARHSATNTVIGAVAGGIVGTNIMPGVGTVAGAVGGAAAQYAWGKAGHAVGKAIYNANHNNVNPSRVIKHRAHAPHIKAHAARGVG